VQKIEEGLKGSSTVKQFQARAMVTEGDIQRCYTIYIDIHLTTGRTVLQASQTEVVE
jgi:hypothetical protein